MPQQFLASVFGDGWNVHFEIYLQNWNSLASIDMYDNTGKGGTFPSSYMYRYVEVTSFCKGLRMSMLYSLFSHDQISHLRSNDDI